MSLTDMDICVAFGKLRRNVAFSVECASVKRVDEKYSYFIVDIPDFSCEKMAFRMDSIEMKQIQNSIE